MEANFDEHLTTDAVAMAELIDVNLIVLQSENKDRQKNVSRGHHRPNHYQITTESGKVLEGSADAEFMLSGIRYWRKVDTTRARGFGAHIYGVNAGLVSKVAYVAQLTLPDGRPGRIVRLGFTSKDRSGTASPLNGHLQASTADMQNNSRNESAPADISVNRLNLYIARDTLELHDLLRASRNTIILVVGLSVVALTLVLSPLIQFGLSPLAGTAKQLASMELATLENNLSIRNPPKEVQVLIRTLGQLLDRIKLAVERERAFTGNVAHELRTPLAGIRVILEVALQRQREPQDYRDTIRQCLDVCEQTQSIIEKLLLIARMDANQLDIENKEIDISEMLGAVLSNHEAEINAKSIRLDADLPNGLIVSTDSDKLLIIMRNLVDNAINYVETGGRIEVKSREQDDEIELQIRNSGCSLTADQILRVSDRFWRGDESRADTGMRSGLGLSICGDLCKRLGIRFNVSCNDGDFCTWLYFQKAIRP